MPKRGENIRKRKDGRWVGRYEKGRDYKGAIIYGSVYGKTYREAKEKLTLAAKGTEKGSVPKNRMLYFREVLLLWMDHNRVHYKGATAKKNQDWSFGPVHYAQNLCAFFPGTEAEPVGKTGGIFSVVQGILRGQSKGQAL